LCASLFTHLGNPAAYPHGYVAEENDACEMDVHYMMNGGPPQPTHVDMTQGYECHFGVVFYHHHFAVLEFILSSRLVIIYDGFKKSWNKQILDILKHDLSILGGKLVNYTYSKHNLRRQTSTDSALDLVHAWAKQNKELTFSNWLVMHSWDFNNIKHAYSLHNGTSLNQPLPTNESIHPGFNLFSKISHHSEVIQRDGGYVCGALACIVVESLLNIADALHHSNRQPAPITVNALPNDNAKSSLLRKGVMDKIMAWLDIMKDNDELNHESNPSS
jgi:hypothetical protein